MTQGWQLLTWAGEHSRQVTWGIAGIVIVALLITGFVSLRGARLRQANEELGQALGEFRSGHYADAATQLTDVASRWQSTAPGRIAALYAANADLKAKKLDAAISGFQALAGFHGWPSYLRQEVLVGLAEALQQKGDTGTAATNYEKAASLSGPYRATAIFSEARCREQLGEKDKARDLYQRYQLDFPNGPEGELAAARLEALAAPA